MPLWTQLLSRKYKRTHACDAHPESLWPRANSETVMALNEGFFFFSSWQNTGHLGARDTLWCGLRGRTRCLIYHPPLPLWNIHRMCIDAKCLTHKGLESNAVLPSCFPCVKNRQISNCALSPSPHVNATATEKPHPAFSLSAGCMERGTDTSSLLTSKYCRWFVVNVWLKNEPDGSFKARTSRTDPD